jgi:hypothetical protein
MGTCGKILVFSAELCQSVSENVLAAILAASAGHILPPQPSKQARGCKPL